MSATIIPIIIISELYSTEMKNGYQWRKGKKEFCTDGLLVNCD